jgi:hypothetical protein
MVALTLRPADIPALADTIVQLIQVGSSGLMTVSAPWHIGLIGDIVSENPLTGSLVLISEAGYLNFQIWAAMQNAE